MARGINDRGVIPPGTGGLSVALYDQPTRRAALSIENTVPTLQLADTNKGLMLPADRYYAHLGMIDNVGAGASDTMPPWLGTVSGTGSVTLQSWDATELALYMTVNDHASSPGYIISAVPFAYPTGWGGEASTFAPKNGEVTTFQHHFRARFNSNNDYTTYGIGWMSGGTANFGTSTDHFIQVLRNTGNWEVGTCDGATISQSSAAGGDGNWHEFKLEWDADAVRLYVDDTLVITKTTNRPTKPLKFLCTASTGVGYDFDIVDMLARWR